ncbi:MAG: hypothetical protein L6R36_002634 [Xanthoria steineri]|nr:MAG: hypothetical protein L6R36_002634 [Xanthoria steineri]
MVRITTWNVNGIRNPFGYQPWRDKRTFAAMFDILEADIVVFQETKIQRKDLVDDMVLVPGWDCYWSLPKHKKGYAGVVIYTRQSVCAPIRAEEGITGTLCPPGSTTSFSDGPQDQQIGGYPSHAQLEASLVDATTLDSEGRCVILEFPAFVLFGVYSPANRDETRDDFRLGFLDVLDARIRNLVAMGKRVILTGDLNISREELDTANAEAAMRKNGYTAEEYMSAPARRMFNQLLDGGKIVGERDQGREKPILWDICRGFHPTRKGMFTCWEQKVNARPGNYGARIDYVLSSLDMKAWFSDSNIQEGLMGSDHCPVYAVIKDQLDINGEMMHTLDLINPQGMFMHGVRQREYSTKDMLPMSGKLIPEFDGRRNIKDMFTRKPPLAKSQSTATPLAGAEEGEDAKIDENVGLSRDQILQADLPTAPLANGQTTATETISPVAGKKRSSAATSTNRPLKRSRSGVAVQAAPANSKGQQSLKGFFTKPTATAQVGSAAPSATQEIEVQSGAGPKPGLEAAMVIHSNETESLTSQDDRKPTGPTTPTSPPATQDPDGSTDTLSAQTSPSKKGVGMEDSDTVHDPIQSKECWSKLFTKPAAPRCESHDEPCKTMLTKKSGMNCGRSFWMCARPLGPSGTKEKNTQWRCPTFIWCSDWNPNLPTTSTTTTT